MGRVRKPRPVVGMRPLWTEVTRFSAVAGEMKCIEINPVTQARQGVLFDVSVMEAARREVKKAGAPRAVGTSQMNMMNPANRSRAKNIERYRAGCRERSARRYEKRMRWFKRLKEEAGCAVCGERFFASLDFHHVDPSMKKGLVNPNKSKSWLIPEMRKCVLLCKNCHYKVHHGALDVTDLPLFDPDKWVISEDAA